MRYHGHTDSPTHQSWRALRQRCNQKSNDRYKNYGGRGIKVCQRWDDFLNFLADMGERPPGYTIDRIDIDGDYCPENCRWLPRALQMKNMKQTIWITIENKTLCLTDWCKELGLKYTMVYQRIKSGMAPTEALTAKRLVRRNSKNGQFIKPEDSIDLT